MRKQYHLGFQGGKYTLSTQHFLQSKDSFISIKFSKLAFTDHVIVMVYSKIILSKRMIIGLKNNTTLSMKVTTSIINCCTSVKILRDLQLSANAHQSVRKRFKFSSSIVSDVKACGHDSNQINWLFLTFFTEPQKLFCIC